MTERTYSQRELAGLFKVSLQTVRLWRIQGKLNGFKVGRFWLFDRKEVSRLIKTKHRAIEGI